MRNDCRSFRSRHDRYGTDDQNHTEHREQHPGTEEGREGRWHAACGARGRVAGSRPSPENPSLPFAFPVRPAGTSPPSGGSFLHAVIILFAHQSGLEVSLTAQGLFSSPQLAGCCTPPAPRLDGTDILRRRGERGSPSNATMKERSLLRYRVIREASGAVATSLAMDGDCWAA
jgi:hypothetical protein